MATMEPHRVRGKGDESERCRSRHQTSLTEAILTNGKQTAILITKSQVSISTLFCSLSLSSDSAANNRCDLVPNSQVSKIHEQAYFSSTKINKETPNLLLSLIFSKSMPFFLTYLSSLLLPLSLSYLSFNHQLIKLFIH